MRSKGIALVTIVALGLLFCIPIFAQVISVGEESAGDGQEEIGFFFDYALFRVPDEVNRYYMECYFGVPLNQLYFLQSEDGLQAHYLLGVRIVDSEGILPTIEHYQETFNTVNTWEETLSNKLNLEQLTIEIPRGSYTLEVGLTDLNTKGLGLLQIELLASEYSLDELGISDIQLASNIIQSENEESPFFKNNMEVIPNPDGIYLKPLEVYYYLEVYGLSGEAGGEMVVKYILARPSGEVVEEISFSSPYSSQNTLLVDSIRFEEGESGPYDFIVEVKDPVTGSEVGASRRILIYEDKDTALLAMITGGETLKPYTEKKALDMRERISLLASDEELERYDQLDLDFKPYFVYQFWKMRDPTPKTEENELEEEFNRRFDYVIDHFSTKNKRGYVTDMGRVYLKYGSPDERIMEPMGIPSMPTIDASTFETEPTEAWFYDTGGQYRTSATFVFVDFDGDGDYTIFTSTEPGYGKLLTQ